MENYIILETDINSIKKQKYEFDIDYCSSNLNKISIYTKHNEYVKIKNDAFGIQLDEVEPGDDSDDSDDNEDNDENDDNDDEKKVKVDAFGIRIQNNSSESNDDSEEFGGGGKVDRIFFKNRIKERDEKLLINNDKIYKKGWSTMCTASEERQPIVITKEEKDNIDKVSGSESYDDHAYKTGSDAEHQNYYICPKYWCIDENIALKEGDVTKKDGIIRSEKCKTTEQEYGKIIEGREDFIYAKANNKYCVPCCFKINKKRDWEKIDAGIEKDRAQVNPKCSSVNESSQKVEDVNVAASVTSEIIINVCNEPLAYNNFPIEKSKISHIPLNVKLLFKMILFISLSRSRYFLLDVW